MADLIRWTIANADAVKVAAAVVRHPVVQAVLDAFPGCGDHGYSRAAKHAPRGLKGKQS
jgi:hypothetical protein